MKGALGNGYPVLLEDVDEIIDPSLDTVLGKAYYTNEGRTIIRYADTDLDYDMGFRIYLHTKVIFFISLSLIIY